MPTTDLEKGLPSIKRRSATPRRSIVWPHHNLPSELTSFVGRRHEIDQIKALLGANRLVTLVGAGGCGKTRLALRVANESLRAFPDGVWLIELAAAENPALVPRVVADALGVQEETGRSIVQCLLAYFGSRRVLLVLDNCEHLAAACATLADSILRHAPSLRLLATSREPLRAEGETTWRVPSLAVPDIASGGSAAVVEAVESVHLFVERARSREPAFALTGRNAPTVVEICQRLDGIPLALELAAALVPALGVDHIARHLDDALDLLVVGNRGVPRQETLRATLDWSYGLLAEPERRALQRLAVFAGGFTPESVEGVLADHDHEKSIALASLVRLVEASLVVQSREGATGRFRLLEPVRQYATEKLIVSGKADEIRRRHADYFLQLAEARVPLTRIGRDESWLRQFEEERDNLRAALEWCWRSGSADMREIGARLAIALVWPWIRSARVGEGSEWLERFIQEGAGVATATRARALPGAGVIAWLNGDSALARQRLDEAVERLDETSAITIRAFALAIRAMVDEPDADASESETRIDESIRLFTASEDTWGVAIAYQVRGIRALHRDDQAKARVSLERALKLFRQVGDGWFAAQALNSLGDLARGRGEDGRAAARYRESLAIIQQQGQRAVVPSIMQNLAYVSLRQGDVARATRLFQDSLGMFLQQGDPRGVAECLAGLAGVIASEQPRLAAWLFGAAQSRLDAVGAAIWPSNQADYQRSVARARASVDAEAFAAEHSAGKTASWPDVVAVLAHIPSGPRPVKRQPSSPAEAATIDALTQREREVAGLVARGMTNRQIADTLVISEGTANLHVKRILGKLGFTSRAGVAAWAVERGVVDDRPLPSTASSGISLLGDAAGRKPS